MARRRRFGYARRVTSWREPVTVQPEWAASKFASSMTLSDKDCVETGTSHGRVQRTRGGFHFRECVDGLGGFRRSFRGTGIRRGGGFAGFFHLLIAFGQFFFQKLEFFLLRRKFLLLRFKSLAQFFPFGCNFRARFCRGGFSGLRHLGRSSRVLGCVPGRSSKHRSGAKEQRKCEGCECFHCLSLLPQNAD
jgi:hypothetical protein